MATVEVKCPACGSSRVYKYGKNKTGTQRYMCHWSECKTKTFRLEYRYEGAKSGIDEKIVALAANQVAYEIQPECWAYQRTRGGVSKSRT